MIPNRNGFARLRAGMIITLSAVAISFWVLWLVSHIGPFHISSVRPTWYHVVNCGSGEIWYQYGTPSSRWDGSEKERHFGFSVREVTTLIQYYKSRTGAVLRIDVGFHFLIPALVCGIYPVVALLRGPVRRELRRRRGYCAWCGYDLTGNASGICTECGRYAQRSV